MPHFPTWFVVICVLFPIVYNIYKNWKNSLQIKSQAEINEL